MKKHANKLAAILGGVLLGAAALGAVTASAADLPARTYTKAPPAAVMAAYDWSGFYIGINGGGGGGQICWNYVTAVRDGGCHDPSGGLVGGQIGYNWQMNSLVLGLELSGDWANLTGSNVAVTAPSGTDNSHVSSLFMATARAGYAWDRALLYVRGGAAWAREDYNVTCNGGGCLPVGAVAVFGSETRLGGIVGAGFEYAITNNLILGVEGDYLPFGTRNITFNSNPGYACGGGVGLPCTVAVKENLWTGTARLSWKFGGPVVARY
jgi:outer membrane immunogenic protein